MAAEAKAAVAVAVMAAEEAVAVVEVTEVRDQNEPAAGAGPVAATRCARQALYWWRLDTPTEGAEHAGLLVCHSSGASR